MTQEVVPLGLEWNCFEEGTIRNNMTMCKKVRNKKKKTLNDCSTLSSLKYFSIYKS
jgi:hypothetical protein